MVYKKVFKAKTSRTMTLCSLAVLSALAASCSKSGGGNSSGGEGGGGDVNSLAATLPPSSCESSGTNFCVLDALANQSQTLQIPFFVDKGSVTNVALNVVPAEGDEPSDWSATCPSTTIEAGTTAQCQVTYTPHNPKASGSILNASLNFSYVNSLGATVSTTDATSSQKPITLTYTTIPLISSMPTPLPLPGDGVINLKNALGLQMNFSNGAPAYELINESFYLGSNLSVPLQTEVTKYLVATNGQVILDAFSSDKTLYVYKNSVALNLAEYTKEPELSTYTVDHSAQNNGAIYVTNYAPKLGTSGKIYKIDPSFDPSTVDPTVSPSVLATSTNTMALFSDDALPIIYTLDEGSSTGNSQLDKIANLKAISTIDGNSFSIPSVSRENSSYRTQLAANGAVYIQTNDLNETSVSKFVFTQDEQGKVTPLDPQPTAFQFTPIPGYGKARMLLDSQNNLLYVSVQTKANGSYILYAFDANSGEKKWESKLLSASSAPFLTKNHNVLVVAPTDAGYGVYVYTKEGLSPLREEADYYPLPQTAADSFVSLSGISIDTSTNALVIPTQKNDLSSSGSYSVNIQW